MSRTYEHFSTQLQQPLRLNHGGNTPFSNVGLTVTRTYCRSATFLIIVADIFPTNCRGDIATFFRERPRASIGDRGYSPDESSLRGYFLNFYSKMLSTARAEDMV